MRNATIAKALGAFAVLLVLACVGFVAEVLDSPDDMYELYQSQQQYAVSNQGSTRFQQLPEYVVSGAMAAPSGGAQAPPQGVVMQFPGSQSQDDEDEEESPKLTQAEKDEKNEKAKQKELLRALDRSKKRYYKVSENIFELKRWIKLQAKEVIRSVKAQTSSLLGRIDSIPGTVGEMGPRGTPGTPGKNGENGPHGQPGPPGPQGEPGPAGPDGVTGPKGPTGVIGPVGDQGPPGPAGKAGPKGIAGGFGPVGEAR